MRVLDENLCSHIWSVCYLAQSLFDDMQMHAEPCTRRCPAGLVVSRRARHQLKHTIGNAIPIGHTTPMKYVSINYLFYLHIFVLLIFCNLSAAGSYCFRDGVAPFCPSSTNSFGDLRCCIDQSEFKTTEDDIVEA